MVMHMWFRYKFIKAIFPFSILINFGIVMLFSLLIPLSVFYLLHLFEFERLGVYLALTVHISMVLFYVWFITVLTVNLVLRVEVFRSIIWSSLLKKLVKISIPIMVIAGIGLLVAIFIREPTELGIDLFGITTVVLGIFLAISLFVLTIYLPIALPKYIAESLKTPGVDPYTVKSHWGILLAFFILGLFIAGLVLTISKALLSQIPLLTTYVVEPKLHDFKLKQVASLLTWSYADAIANWISLEIFVPIYIHGVKNALKTK